MSVLDDMEERNEKAAYVRGYSDGAAQAREDLLDALDRDWKGRYVEDAVAEIRRFPASLRTGGERR